MQVLKLAGASHSDVMECMRFLPGNLLVSKSCDGVMHAWDFDARTHNVSWKVGRCRLKLLLTCGAGTVVQRAVTCRPGLHWFVMCLAC